MIQSVRFIGVVVITSALHAEGPGFNPQMNQDLFFLQATLFYRLHNLQVLHHLQGDQDHPPHQ